MCGRSLTQTLSKGEDLTYEDNKNIKTSLRGTKQPLTMQGEQNGDDPA
jgi:hypothetical protein